MTRASQQPLRVETLEPLTLDELNRRLADIDHAHELAQRRYVRPAPWPIREFSRASDLAANQLRRQLIEPSRLERFTTWGCVGLSALVTGYFLIQSLRGWLS